MSESILSKLPRKEQIYLADKSSSIIRQGVDVENTSELLSVLTDSKSKREYGWAEAVLQNKFYRYPSEIENQIFCSENSLDDYLSLNAMKKKCHYALIKNYYGSKMAHEAVLLHEKNKLLIFDWENTYEVKFDGKKLINVETGKKVGSKVEFIKEDDLIDRVESFRNGASFLDAICCGQLLYRKELENNLLDMVVKYDKQGKIQFTYIMRHIFMSAPFYLTFQSAPSEKNSKVMDSTFEGGYVLNNKKKFNFKKVKMFESDEKGKMVFPDFLSELENDRKYDVSAYILYKELIDIDNGEEGFATTVDERNEVINLIRNFISKNEGPEDAISQAKRIFDIYTHLNMFEPEKAEKFLDYQTVALQLMGTYSADEAIEIIKTKHEFDNKKVENYILSLLLQELGSTINYDFIKAEKAVLDELSKKTGLDYDYLPFIELHCQMDYLSKVDKK